MWWGEEDDEDSLLEEWDVGTRECLPGGHGGFPGQKYPNPGNIVCVTLENGSRSWQNKVLRQLWPRLPTTNLTSVTPLLLLSITTTPKEREDQSRDQIKKSVMATNDNEMHVP